MGLARGALMEFLHNFAGVFYLRCSGIFNTCKRVAHGTSGLLFILRKDSESTTLRRGGGGVFWWIFYIHNFARTFFVCRGSFNVYSPTVHETLGSFFTRRTRRWVHQFEIKDDWGVRSGDGSLLETTGFEPGISGSHVLTTQAPLPPWWWSYATGAVGIGR